MAVDVPEVRFRAAADDPLGLLEALGAATVSTAQRAFDEQEGPRGPWPEPYEGREPRVRMANLVGSLLMGQRPPDRVLDRRPAGRYSGELYRSITHRVTEVMGRGGAVEAGSWLEYADQFHSGGRTTQPITPEVRGGLGRWLDSLDPPDARRIRRSLRRDRKKVRALKGDTSPRATRDRVKLRESIDHKRGQLKDARSNEYRKAVGFLFGVDELETNSVGRPFIGATETLEKDLADLTERYYALGGS